MRLCAKTTGGLDNNITKENEGDDIEKDVILLVSWF
jgi:hypothetical protein